MTTLTDYGPYEEVLDRVDQVRARLRLVRLLEGFLLFAIVAALVVLTATLAQGFIRFGPVGRLALLVGGGAAVLAAFWRGVIAPLRDDPSDKETARFIETRLPGLENSLINALLLGESEAESSPALVERAIREAAESARGADLGAAVTTGTARRRAILAFLACAALAGWAVAAWPRFVSAGRQILSPFDPTIASVGSVRLLALEPASGAWPKGDPLEVRARIENPDDRAYDGWVEIARAGEAVRRERLLRGADASAFTYRVPQVIAPFDFRVGIGGTESGWHSITLREAPVVRRIDLKYIYPDYTGLEPLVEEDSPGEIRCLAGTEVEVTAHVTAPVGSMSLVFGSGPVRQCLASEDGRRLTTRFTVLADDTYQVRLQGDTPGGAAVTHRIIALPDEPPTVTLTFPRGDMAAGLGETIRVGVRATDKYGVGELALMGEVEGGGTPEVLARWTAFRDPKDVTEAHPLRLAAPKLKLGQKLAIWAVAKDGRTYQGGATPRGPNVAETPRVTVTIEDREKAARERMAELGRLYDRLREILLAQEKARTGTSAAARVKDAVGLAAAGEALAEAQRVIREATLAVTRDVKFDDTTLPIRETLLVLAANEMASAVAKARAFTEAPNGAAADRAPPLAAALAADQDVIIDALRRILDIVPKLTDAVKEELEQLAASDLPPDAQARLKALREKLKEFAEEQKRVIEASKDLAKRPVDDFTDADQRELERLQAIEDDWEKFLTEAISDLSKIPDLDASNPSLVRELIEVKTDVEMARDALSKKAMDIVVPLEELGMEGAEEIVENLERWLPDTPDRERWQQEEMTSDAEIPHAELPEEMEDLVGDLLEQEEDLFEEIEDVTSNAADSIDKGAGWDAMDGPISNFSAKGVTGNRLPNTSEIGGRSGEGRTGKASGEFVEEEATGKGGRRTPTRLTQEAFSQGEVKDSSEEAPTGATGGGKISGAGSEGLEGPVPPDVQRRMGDLAGRQAQLRNKAEGVKAALEVRNYDSFALGEVIDQMKKVQRDLLAGRYDSALRRRDILLKDLKTSKMLLGGEVRVRRDSSAAVPDQVQEEVLDALEKPMPRGYEAYLKQYYKRLSEGG